MEPKSPQEGEPLLASYRAFLCEPELQQEFEGLALLKQVAQRALELSETQEYPIEKMQALRIARDTAIAIDVIESRAGRAA